MTEPKNPSEIAREALKRLAVSHLPPTPANYQACYNEIADLPNVLPFPEQQLRQLASELVARDVAQKKYIESLDGAISRRSWQGVQEAMLGLFASGASAGKMLEPVCQSVLPVDFAIKLARFIECSLPALGEENGQVGESAAELLCVLRQRNKLRSRGFCSNCCT